MASGGVLSAAPARTGGAFLPEDLHHMEQCQKILHFRDQVLSGTHPRIKPAHLAAKPRAPSASNAPPPTTSAIAAAAPPSQPSLPIVNGDTRVVEPMRSPRQGQKEAAVTISPQSTNASHALPSNVGPSASGKTEIDPVLLEKSDDLIRAEIQLQRRRLERSLRDQIEQRHASTKAFEPLADFDLADVLSRALTLVRSTVAQTTDETVANASASSDSFDDNTFYSSRHDTPESLQTSRLPNVSEDEQMRDSSPYEPELDLPPVVHVQPPQTRGANPSSQSHDNAPATIINQQPANAALPQSAATAHAPASTTESSQKNTIIIPGLHTMQVVDGAGSRGRDGANRLPGRRVMATEGGARHPLPDINRQLLRLASPVIRSHNLSPLAPQPAYVSPLALTSQPPAGHPPEPDVRRATPPQVAALRKEVSAGTSPESGSQGSRTADKKKGKRKKRKADRQGAENAASPLIKTEPRSPSPGTAAVSGRPAKRQRQTQRPQDALEYSVPRYEQPVLVDDGYHEHYQSRGYREDRVSGLIARSHELQPRHEPRTVAAPPEFEDSYYQRPPQAGAHYAHPSPSLVYPAEHGSLGAVRLARPASHVDVERPQQDAPVQVRYHDVRDDPRISMRLGQDAEQSRSPIIYQRPVSFMAPPRPAPRRIYLDEFGREYIEPSRPTPVIRQSVAPGGGAGELDLSYERLVPSRAASRLPEPYEQNGIVYRRASPPRIPQRRVATQPEVRGPEYHVYREREYSARPMGHAAERNVPCRAHVESRLITEPSREYLARTSSARPLGDNARYDAAEPYERRPVAGPELDRSLRASSIRPTEPSRYEEPLRSEGYIVGSRNYPGTGSARPVEAVRYEAARGYGPSPGAVQPDISAREYAASIHPEARREAMPPPIDGRAYSTRPAEDGIPIDSREYRLRPAGAYYERPMLRGEEEIVYVGQAPRSDMYHPAQRGRP